MIAIDVDKRLFYEGASNWGHGIWPSPVVSIATLLTPGDDPSTSLSTVSRLESAKYVFREDTFDPVTRIRRGRFYINPGTQPQQWHVQTHPAFKEETGQKNPQGYLIKYLYGFHPWAAFVELNPEKGERLIALGTQDAFTLWRVIGIERIVTGEDMVTLRARSALGVLPDLRTDNVPEVGRGKVMETLDKVTESVYRAGPESVIDRCRDAAQASLGVWMSDKYDDEGLRHIDLGDQIKSLKQLAGRDLPVIVVGVCKSLARLHTRCKPNEQVKRTSRLPEEGDAESAVAMLGLLLRELGWCPS